MLPSIGHVTSFGSYGTPPGTLNQSKRDYWCERGDSNPHGFTRQILSLVRLPIPPLSHWAETAGITVSLADSRFEQKNQQKVPAKENVEQTHLSAKLLDLVLPSCHQFCRRLLRDFFTVVQHLQSGRQP